MKVFSPYKLRFFIYFDLVVTVYRNSYHVVVGRYVKTLKQLSYHLAVGAD